jgi:hypothetical protein
MADIRDEPPEAAWQKLRDRSRSHTNELRTLNERTTQLEKRVENLGRALVVLDREHQLAEQVAQELAERATYRWTRWQRALLFVALVPAYVGMLIVLGQMVARIGG